MKKIIKGGAEFVVRNQRVSGVLRKKITVRVPGVPVQHYVMNGFGEWRHLLGSDGPPREIQDVLHGVLADCAE